MRIVKRLNVHDSNNTPALLQISYAESSPQVQVSRLLWPAWTCLPPSEMTSANLMIDVRTMQMHRGSEVKSFISKGLSLSDDEIAALPRNADQSSIHTSWRDEVYCEWNHVFFDVANWLQAQSHESADIGHLHPPNSEAFGLEIPASGAKNKMIRIWDVDVLALPAFIQPGMKLRVSSTTPGAVESRGNMFDTWTKGDIYYVRRGVEVKFDIERGTSNISNTLGAVIVYGKLCSDEHDPDDPPGGPEQMALTESEAEEEELQMEIQESMSIAFATAARMYRPS